MSLWSRLLGARGSAAPAVAPPPPDLQPQAALGSWGGTVVHTSAELEQVLRGGSATAAGVSVFPETAGAAERRGLHRPRRRSRRLWLGGRLMRLVLVTPPAAPPITLMEARTQCRISHDDEHLLIQHYIDAATAWLDGPTGILGRCPVTQNWRAELAAVTGPIQLPFPDSVIDSAVFTDAAAGELVHDLTQHDQRPLLLPVLGFGRPAAITFTAGRGAPSNVPAAIRQPCCSWSRSGTSIGRSPAPEPFCPSRSKRCSPPFAGSGCDHGRRPTGPAGHLPAGGADPPSRRHADPGMGRSLRRTLWDHGED